MTGPEGTISRVSLKKVVLTGAGGFIGRRCAPFLVEKGYEVIAMGRGNRPYFIPESVDWLSADILDLPVTAALIKSIRPTHILNLAWYTEHGKFWNAKENLLWVSAVINLFTAFNDSGGSRFVGAGSCAEYDWNYGFLSEDITPRLPRSLFGCCKNSFYEMAMQYAALTGASFAWGRVFFVFGPNENESRLVASIIRSLLSGKKAKSTSGEQIRDFSYVDNVASFFVSLLESNVTGGVNIASGQPVRVKELISMIAKEIGNPELVELGAFMPPEDDPPMLVADVRKLFGEVGASPGFDIASGLSKTIEFYKEEIKS